jgi:hypothetical protein
MNDKIKTLLLKAYYIGGSPLQWKELSFRSPGKKVLLCVLQDR